jgi:PIN domain nuclease of toxin-antitoxin system
MRHLIDTQSLIWYVDQDQLLSTVAHGAISNPANDLVLSAASVWEIAIKVGLGKLKLSLSYRQWMTKAMADLGVVVLPISVEYADMQSRLPRHHGDPFDRLIVAQCIVEGVPIISSDALLDAYGISRIW